MTWNKKRCNFFISGIIRTTNWSPRPRRSPTWWLTCPSWSAVAKERSVSWSLAPRLWPTRQSGSRSWRRSWPDTALTKRLEQICFRYIHIFVKNILSFVLKTRVKSATLFILVILTLTKTMKHCFKIIRYSLINALKNFDMLGYCGYKIWSLFNLPSWNFQ